MKYKQRARRDRDQNDVIGERPKQVLPDIAHRCPAQGDRRRDTAQIAPHQDHIGRFDGNIGARSNG